MSCRRIQLVHAVPNVYAHIMPNMAATCFPGSTRSLRSNPNARLASCIACPVVIPFLRSSLYFFLTRRSISAGDALRPFSCCRCGRCCFCRPAGGLSIAPFSASRFRTDLACSWLRRYQIFQRSSSSALCDSAAGADSEAPF